jgi:serine/threonine-protein kinase 19
VLLGKGLTEYWLAVPGAGAVLGAVRGARTEIISCIKKGKFQELSLDKLLAKALKNSPAPVQWHLQDMLGSGEIIQFTSAGGQFLCLPKTVE